MEDRAITHREIERSGTRLHYWVAGPLGRPLVVFTKEEIKAIYAFLRLAMRQAPPENPYRGPREFAQGAFCYRDENEGDLRAFSGIETITRDDQLVYTLRYNGGFLR